MKNIVNNNKPLLIVLSGAVILLLIIIVPFLIFGERNAKPKDKNFPNYTKIKIDKNTFNDEVKKQNIEDILSKDKMFQKVMMVDDYNSSKMSRKDLENMIVNYAKIFEKSNTKYLPKTDYKYACMKENYFVDSYNELYNTDITKYLKDMTYYYKNIFKKKNYCFYYPVVEPKNIYLKFNSISSNDGIIEANIDIYSYMESFGSTDWSKSEGKFISLFKNKKYYDAKNILMQELYGNYMSKNIRFKINNVGKFFKYQIISIKTIDN